MSSLYSFVKKGKISAPPDPELAPLQELLVPFIHRCPPHLIDANHVIDGLPSEIPSTAVDFTPGYQFLWAEWIGEQGREAVHIYRAKPEALAGWRQLPKKCEGARHLIQTNHFLEDDGVAVLMGHSTVFVDGFGIPSDDVFLSGRQQDSDALNWRFSVAVEIVSIMNTRGTRIEPPIEKHSEVVKPNRAPHSVWHTIHLPRFQAPPLQNAVIDGAVLERREYWVRAHRKDYRQGAGMFGRVKALVWVPEYQRGNPELGSVKQSFALHPPEEREQGILANELRARYSCPWNDMHAPLRLYVSPTLHKAMNLQPTVQTTVDYLEEIRRRDRRRRQGRGKG